MLIIFLKACLISQWNRILIKYNSKKGGALILRVPNFKVGVIMKFRPLISFTVIEKHGQDSRDQLLEKKNLRYELILSWQVGPHLRVWLLVPPISLVVTGQQAARAGTTSIRWRQKLGVGKTWGANASERCDTCMRPETYISLCTEPFQHEVSLYAARSAFSFLFYLMYPPDKAIYSLPKPSVICYRLAVSYMQPR